MEKDDENMEREEYDLEKDNLSYGHAQADYLFRKYGPSGKPRSAKPKKSQEEKDAEKKSKLEKMALFVNRADSLHLDPNKLFDSFEGRQEKINLIRNYKGVFDATSYYSPRLEKLFQSYYNSFKKKIAK